MKIFTPQQKKSKTKKLLLQRPKGEFFGVGMKTESSKETQALGKILAEELRGGCMVCLEGNLGSGKTTFTQGLLKGLKAKGPYTSPTFLIMKKYGENIFHLDAYRVKVEDILHLGWEEMLTEKKNIIIVEWADRIRKIIPSNAIWVKFKWVDENKREITFGKKL